VWVVKERKLMSNEKIVLVARLKVKSEMVEVATKAALELVTPSRAEAGCINYDVHQAIDDETVFVWHETWKSKTALDEHFETPEFKTFFAIAGEIAAEPSQMTITKIIS
jgi:quinol monooxygenase YgiN